MPSLLLTASCDRSEEALWNSVVSAPLAIGKLLIARSGPNLGASITVRAKYSSLKSAIRISKFTFGIGVSMADQAGLDGLGKVKSDWTKLITEERSPAPVVMIAWARLPRNHATGTTATA